MKKLIILALLTALSSKAYAASEPLKITIGGKLDTQIGYASQKNEFKNLYDYNSDNTLKPISKRGDYAVVNDTNIDLNITGKSNHGFTYGGRIRLNADTSVNAANNDDTFADRTMIFIESKLGRLEGGAYNSASDQMRVSGSSIARAAGGIDGKVHKWFGKGPRVNNQNDPSGKFSQRYILVPELPVDCDCISYTNKVTYFTPKFNGLSAGISYSPDTSVHGTIAKFQSVTRKTGKDFEDLFDYGINYENKFQDISYKLGLTGEIAKSKKATDGSLDRKDLNAWEAGAVITYKEFSISGSYSDWGKSATPKNKVAGKKYGAKFWTAGVAYVKGNFGTSLTYFNSKRANVYAANVPPLTTDHDPSYNKLEYLVLGVDYKLAQGLLPYGEVGMFKARDSIIKSNKGYVVLTGMKLTF